MSIFKTLLFAVVFLAAPLSGFSTTFTTGAKYTVCFTPGQNCTQKIIETINASQQQILVQAYSFTSEPIAKALLAAKNRGVIVKVILDKSQYKAEKYSAAKFFANQNIPVWIDSRVAISHSKVMIVDQNTVITGSFNFTKAAQEKNAENLLIVHDASIAELYTTNWENRLAVSTELADYKPRTKKTKTNLLVWE